MEHTLGSICDPLWETVHFRAKCNIELCMKIAESGPLAVQLDYDTGENYSLSSTIFVLERCSCAASGAHRVLTKAQGQVQAYVQGWMLGRLREPTTTPTPINRASPTDCCSSASASSHRGKAP